MSGPHEDNKFSDGRYLMYLDYAFLDDARKICDAVDGRITREIGSKVTKGRIRAVLKNFLSDFRELPGIEVSSLRPSTMPALTESI